MKLYKIFFFILTICLNSTIYGQLPTIANAACASAPQAIANGSCFLMPTSAAPINDPVYSGTCAATVTKDGWAFFIATNTIVTISASGNRTSTTNLALALYAGPACPAGASIACANSVASGTGIETETITYSPLTIGQKYYLRILNQHNTSPATTVCITSPNRNDDPSGAFPLPAASAVCTSTFSSTKSATKTTTCGITTPACSSTYGASSNDVWFTATVPAAGLFLQTTAGSMTQAGMAVYTGAPCGTFTEIGCSEGNPEGSTLGGMPVMYLPAGTPSPVYIRVWNKQGQTAGTFSICGTTLGPCGNVSTNDFCSNPTSINTAGATNTMIATNNAGLVFTNDNPGDIASVYSCPGPGTNSWYSFIATNNDETLGLSLPFTMNSSNCTGLDAEIFAVATNTYGCCKNFTQLGDGCSDDKTDGAGNGSVFDWTGFNTFTLTVNPGVLTAGNNYYLMVNNYETACSYSITGWSLAGTLPVDLISFKGKNEGKRNYIEWVVSSEKNITSYTLEHSVDAVSFSPVIKLNSQGSSLSNIKHSAYDENPFEDVTYYRIKQSSISGKDEYSNTISVGLSSKYDNIYNIHPNPTSNNLNFEFYTKSNSTLNIELLNYAGASVLKANQPLEEGKNNITLPMNELDNGVYILKVVSEKSGKTTHHKIIKN